MKRIADLRSPIAGLYSPRAILYCAQLQPNFAREDANDLQKQR
jgi:hypothetical protein